MRAGELILMSVDDHVVEPAHLLDLHMPAQWQDRVPKMAKNG
jgi:hypothetical protein